MNFTWPWTTPPVDVTAATQHWLAEQEQASVTSDRAQILTLHVRLAAVKQQLRDANRRYGRASATIGLERMRNAYMSSRIALLRSELAEWRRVHGTARPVDEQRGADEALVEAMQRHPSEGAAITLAAHAPVAVEHLPESALFVECRCGHDTTDHPRHVAEQLATAGTLGATTAPVATPPAVLIDRDGDTWPIVSEEAVYRAPNPELGHHTRAEIERMWGPVTERPAHPTPRTAVRTGSFAVGRARGLADDASW